MTSAAPSVVALEIDSAWVLILVVSLITFPAALIFRAMINRPGGFASGMLLVIPLVLPPIAALAYAHSALPEVAVLRPVTSATLGHRSGDLLHLLYVSTGTGGRGILYALYGGPGAYLLLFGVAVTSLMLLRRAVGMVAVRRLLRRCYPLDGPSRSSIEQVVARLTPLAGLTAAPRVLVLPAGVSGAFVRAGRHSRILMSSDLIESLEAHEMEALIAHEMAHLAAHDVLLMGAAALLRDMVAWNPIAHLSLRRLASDREYEADRRAAEWTGRPLALASSLIKVWEVMESRVSLGQKLTVSFLKPRGRIARRVTNLLALADGGAPARRTAALPYVAGACLAALLGLQASAWIAESQGAAVAFILGSPESSTRTWPGAGRGAALEHTRAKEIGGIDSRKARGAGWRLFMKLDGGLSLWERDLPEALTAMKEWIRRQDIAPATATWRGDEAWRAEPLIGPRIGPIGIYRMNFGSLAPRAPE